MHVHFVPGFTYSNLIAFGLVIICSDYCLRMRSTNITPGAIKHCVKYKTAVKE